MIRSCIVLSPHNGHTFNKYLARIVEASHLPRLGLVKATRAAMQAWTSCRRASMLTTAVTKGIRKRSGMGAST